MQIYDAEKQPKTSKNKAVDVKPKEQPKEPLQRTPEVEMTLDLNDVTAQLEDKKLSKKLFYDIFEGNEEFEKLSKLKAPIGIMTEWYLKNDRVSRFSDISSLGETVIANKLKDAGVIDDTYACSINSFLKLYKPCEDGQERVHVILITSDEEPTPMHRVK